MGKVYVAEALVRKPDGTYCTVEVTRDRAAFTIDAACVKAMDAELRQKAAQVGQYVHAVWRDRE